MNRADALRFRVIKAVNTVTYLALIVLTWRFFAGDLHWKLAIGAVVISGCWLALTYVKMSHLLKTYFDTLSRFEFLLPAFLSIALVAFALVRAHHTWVRLAAAAELGAWVVLLAVYRRNRRRYVKQGHGPVPADSWISPPAHVLEAGDLLLTSGRMAVRLRESVGHSELVVRMADGSMRSFSSYMGRGTVLHPLDRVTSGIRGRGHYLALRPRSGLTDDQVRRVAEIAIDMLEANASWRARTNQRRRRVIRRLPLPRSWKRRLVRALKTDGYDWFGLFMGRRARNRWTCIGACLELYVRLDVKTASYGTGLLGFGTSLLDPIMPVRLLGDPAFRLLSIEDRDEPLPRS